MFNYFIQNSKKLSDYFPPPQNSESDPVIKGKIFLTEDSIDEESSPSNNEVE